MSSIAATYSTPNEIPQILSSVICKTASSPDTIWFYYNKRVRILKLKTQFDVALVFFLFITENQTIPNLKEKELFRAPFLNIEFEIATVVYSPTRSFSTKTLARAHIIFPTITQKGEKAAPTAIPTIKSSTIT